MSGERHRRRLWAVLRRVTVRWRCWCRAVDHCPDAFRDMLHSGCASNVAERTLQPATVRRGPKVGCSIKLVSQRDGTGGRTATRLTHPGACFLMLAVQ